MTQVLTIDRGEVVPFVCERAEIRPDMLTPGYSCIGLKENGVVIGGVVFEGYSGTCVEMHMAGDGSRWITRPLLRAVFRYAFDQLGCKVVRGRVPSTNTNAFKLNLRLGFQLEHVLDDASPKGAHYLMRMRRAECRFLEV